MPPARIGVTSLVHGEPSRGHRGRQCDAGLDGPGATPREPMPVDAWHRVSVGAPSSCPFRWPAGAPGHREAPSGPPAARPRKGVYGSSCTERERTGPTGPGKPPDEPPGFDRRGTRCKVEIPPRTKAKELAGSRARPLLENSTACRKSVPSSKPPYAVSCWDAVGIPLVD